LGRTIAKRKKKRLWAVQGLNIFFWSTKSFASKNQTAPDFFFLWSQLHLGKLHRERAVTGKIFQALPTQTNTIIVAFPGVIENDLLWAGVCPGRLGRIFQALPTQTDTPS
jgi:hypothetical protein